MLLAVHIYFKRLFNPSLKEINFTYTDIAISQGIEFLDEFLSKKFYDVKSYENTIDNMLEMLN